MIFKYYSIYDRKAVVYMPPFHALTDAAAVRSVQDAMSDPQTSLHRHPDDFVLFFVGEFDDATAMMFGKDAVRHVVDVASLAAKPVSSNQPQE